MHVREGDIDAVGDRATEEEQQHDGGGGEREPAQGAAATGGVGVGGGLALTGMRPILHTFASFLVERPFEQV
ncbi:hypothetical protein ACWEWX_36780, partial [Streptomyces asiaticus]